MKLSFLPYFLEFKHPFGLSSNTRTQTAVVFTKIEFDGKIGFGESSLPPYLGETQKSVIDFLVLAQSLLKEVKTPVNLAQLIERIDALANNNNAAKAGIDIALHDLISKLLNKPYYAFAGIEKSAARSTSFTIAIGDENLIPQKIKEAEKFSFLKIKLGTTDDKKIINSVRNYTDKPLVVDVNQGWKDKSFVIEMIDWLSQKNVLFVEQPMPIANREDMFVVLQKSKLPIIADESVKRFIDIDNAIGCFSGINIKLMKCTGMHEAKKMIDYAQVKGLKISLGCMSESSCAISAMAQFIQYADWIDLDGPQLLKSDPFTGVNYIEGKVTLNDKNGIGAEPTIYF